MIQNFLGGKPTHSLWNQINDNKAIKKIEYYIGNKGYILSGFEKYNHIVKHGIQSVGWNGIIFVSIMGLYKRKVYQVIFDVLKKKIYKNVRDFGKEYNNKAHTGWKQGIISNQKPTILPL